MLGRLSPIAIAKSHLRSFLATRRSPLPAPLKYEISRAMRRLDRMKIEKNKTVNLLGYDIAFHDEVSFRYLFTEIFGKAVYFFEAANDHPKIVDCGSNIGMSILFFKKLYPLAQIVGFEPDPSTFKVLNGNVKQNGLTDVTTHQAALAARDGFVDFYRDESENSLSLLMSTDRQRHPGRKKIQVPARRLSEFIDGEVDLLKIDVEGAEIDVVQDLIARNKLRLARRIHLEYHHHIGTSPDNLSTMLRLLEGAGFGYQLQADPNPWPAECLFQDVSLYCYRKDCSSRVRES
jgi:FkbM family methyltransferase